MKKLVLILCVISSVAHAQRIDTVIGQLEWHSTQLIYLDTIPEPTIEDAIERADQIRNSRITAMENEILRLKQLKFTKLN